MAGTLHHHTTPLLPAAPDAAQRRSRCGTAPGHLTGTFVLGLLAVVVLLTGPSPANAQYVAPQLPPGQMYPPPGAPLQGLPVPGVVMPGTPAPGAPVQGVPMTAAPAPAAPATGSFGQCFTGACQPGQCLGGLCTPGNCVCGNCGSGGKCMIDPSGRSIFTRANTEPEYRLDPGKVRRSHDVYLTLHPNVITAPVGSEVILVSGICGRDQKMSLGKQIEWSIETGSVGHIVDLQHHRTSAVFLTNYVRPKKISSTYAIGSTSPEYVMLTRGTPTMEDDIPIQAGQTWVSVTSPREGTTYVTAYAPDVYGWDSRKQSAVIEWVDAQWQFPPSAVNPVGQPHTLTTTITRHSDQSPVEGWLVRYEIVDGPEARFAPEGVTIVEQQTNALGQASVQLVQGRQETGTNNIKVEIIRPADTSVGSSRRIVLGTAMMQKTWTSPEVALDITGPSQGGIGESLTYRINVRNLGQLPLRDVLVTDPLPQGLEFVSSVPPASGGAAPSWSLGDLNAGDTRTIDVTVRATGAGNLNHCVHLNTASGLSADDCAATTILTPSLNMQVEGPEQAVVGDRMLFTIVVTNGGGATASGLLLRDEFDEGLVHEQYPSPIETDVPPIPPGGNQRVEIVLRADRAGDLCQRLQLFGDGTIRANQTKCTAVVGAAQPSVSVRKWIPAQGNGPYNAQIGDRLQFQIDVTNNSSVAVADLTLVENYTEELDPVNATQGYTLDQNVNLTWRIPSLAANETRTFVVECNCRNMSAQSCNRAFVIDARGNRIADSEACVAIQSRQSSLQLDVTPSLDRLAVGGATTCVITLTNHGPQAAREVEIAAELPEGVELDRAPFGPSRHQVVDRTIRFSPIVELAPGEVLTYRVPLRAVDPGAREIRAHARSAGAPQGPQAATPLLIESGVAST
ncbi:MAG: DUF11 domain-containing protein [Pirellulales bacterium]